MRLVVPSTGSRIQQQSAFIRCKPVSSPRNWMSGASINLRNVIGNSLFLHTGRHLPVCDYSLSLFDQADYTLYIHMVSLILAIVILRHRLPAAFFRSRIIGSIFSFAQATRDWMCGKREKALAVSEYSTRGGTSG